MKKSKRMIMAYIRINGVEKQLIDKAFKPVPKVGLPEHLPPQWDASNL